MSAAWRARRRDGPSSGSAENTRTRPASAWPGAPVVPPTMSLLSTATIGSPKAAAAGAWKRLPLRPGSSAAKATKRSVASHWRRDITRTSSSSTATPEASSSAPGASAAPSATFSDRLS